MASDRELAASLQRSELEQRNVEHEQEFNMIISEAQALDLASGYVPQAVKAMCQTMLEWEDDLRRAAARPVKRPRRNHDDTRHPRQTPGRTLMPNELYFTEQEMADVCGERDRAHAETGQVRNLAHRARTIVDELICADGPDDLWAMVCAGLGRQVIELDRILRTVAHGPETK